MRANSAVRILRFDSIDSTNAEACRYVGKQQPLPVWIVAAEQTAGRGRLGRQWTSERGNFFATFVFQTAASAMAASHISFVAALAVLEVVQKLRPDAQFSLKWPNDVLLDGAKFCGILADIITQQPLVIGLGIGINLVSQPDGMPYPVASLGGQFHVDAVLDDLKAALMRWLAIWADGTGFAQVREAWLQHAMGFGAPVQVDGVDGSFAGLADDGALVMQLANDTRKHIYAGDVRLSPHSHNQPGTKS